MYLILTSSKDTYVTNRKLSSNDARYANVGDAASLDLFKLQSENKLVKAQAELTLNVNPTNGQTFTLVDAKSFNSLLISRSISTEEIFKRYCSISLKWLRVRQDEGFEFIKRVIKPERANR